MSTKIYGIFHNKSSLTKAKAFLQKNGYDYNKIIKDIKNKKFKGKTLGDPEITSKPLTKVSSFIITKKGNNIYIKVKGTIPRNGNRSAAGTRKLGNKYKVSKSRKRSKSRKK